MPRRTVADPIAQAFGGAIRQVRTERGETLEAVAHRIPRLDAKYLGEIERGWHAPTISTAVRIADALGVPLTDLAQRIDAVARPSEPNAEADRLSLLDGSQDGQLDRQSFLREVGISSRTLTRWVGEGYVVPATGHRDGRQVHLFSKDDAKFARALAKMLKVHKGRYRLAQAVAIVRNEMLPPELPVDPAQPFPAP